VPKVVNHDERRSEVLGAVWRVIERVGIERVTVRAIAKEAGYSAGILVHYFEDKEDILTSALRLSHERIRARWADKLQNRVGLDALRELVLDNLPLDDERRLETRLEISYWARALSNDDVLNVQRREAGELHARVFELVEQAQARGELSAARPAAETTELLLALIDGLSLHSMLYPALVSPQLQTSIIERVLAELALDPPG
jgi:AcrR family transcriptional regulator